jgi:uncharacterized zinc-type alcohol dehydrogenase-like protein
MNNRKVLAYAAYKADENLKPFDFVQRDCQDKDVEIEIYYCGVCHSDIHQARNEWGGSTFPMVPGHEIIGKVIAVGSAVSKFKVGDWAGVGCMVDSCQTCSHCKAHEEQYCKEGVTWSYNSMDKIAGRPTYGGYATHIICTEAFVLSISKKFENNLAATAPLLCAGITTFSPLKKLGVGKGKKIGIIGLGGLGHMAVKIAVAMGAEVTVLSTSENKKADALKLGAHHFALTTKAENMQTLAGSFDAILNTVSAPIDYNAYLNLLNIGGTLAVVGIPAEAVPVNPAILVMQRKQILGSLIGGIAETQEMLDFCAEKGIVSDIEIIKVQAINEAYERVLKSDVKYRFVIDVKQSDMSK